MTQGTEPLRGETQEPTFDADHYPTDETLRLIREWSIDSMQAAADAMDFAGKAWAYSKQWEMEERWDDPDWPSHPKRVYRFSTGGWSGNESIVSAIEENQMLQILGAWSWRRGGHYEYRFPLPEELR